jgi:hypothetical protein
MSSEFGVKMETRKRRGGETGKGSEGEHNLNSLSEALFKVPKGPLVKAAQAAHQAKRSQLEFGVKGTLPLPPS